MRLAIGDTVRGKVVSIGPEVTVVELVGGGEGTLETLQHLQQLTGSGVAFKSYTEQYLDGTGIFKDAIIGILAALLLPAMSRAIRRNLAAG